jgi:hypothetical protein
LPSSLLWDPPLANPREPRMFVKFTNLDDQMTYETAIGAEVGLIRLTHADPDLGCFQLDLFGVVFTRFDEEFHQVVSDYRAGIPLTYANGPWQAKLAYEHTSSHLGDEFIDATRRERINYQKDEIVVGVSYRFENNLRLYGQFGYAFFTSKEFEGDRERFDWGLEWKQPGANTGWRGRPFIALDMELRAEQDFEPNTTIQLGWEWSDLPRGRSVRVAFEFYDGKSPYGQFYSDDEDWVGLGVYYDW